MVAEETAYSCNETILILHFAFPYNQHTETKRLQLFKIRSIPASVPFQFRKPIVEPGFRNMRVDTLAMLMPKASTNFNDFLEPREYKVRLARKLVYMEPIAVT